MKYVDMIRYVYVYTHIYATIFQTKTYKIMQHQADNPGPRPDTITLHKGKPNRAGSHRLDEENIGTCQFEV